MTTRSVPKVFSRAFICRPKGTASSCPSFCEFGQFIACAHIPLLEETVKNAINKVVHRMAKGMIAGGDSIATSDGITVRVIKSPK